MKTLFAYKKFIIKTSSDTYSLNLCFVPTESRRKKCHRKYLFLKHGIFGSNFNTETWILCIEKLFPDKPRETIVGYRTYYMI